MKKNDIIYVSGHRGLLGGAIVRELQAQGFTNIWTTTREEVDLTCRESVKWFFDECQPDYVFHCAAKVGGILDNSEKPVEFFLENMSIQNNVLSAAHAFNVKKFLFVSTAAVYPLAAENPLRPEQILTGALDETKGGYATAKIAGMKLCHYFRQEYKRDFFSVVLNNLYGPGDTSTHVIPSLLSRFHSARQLGGPVICWGTGNARREFVFVDDAARACVFLMQTYGGSEPVNIGTGQEVTVKELAQAVRKTTGFRGVVTWDRSKPDGAMRRLLDATPLLEMGWKPLATLEEGLRLTYEDYICPLR